MRDSLANAKSIFGQALDIQSQAERAKYLDEACQGNVTLRAEVEELIGAVARAGNFLGDGSPEQRHKGYEVVEGVGTIIGPYKLVEQIGEGGFGVVYLAEQERPVKRRVALKIIKPGMDTRQVIARFEAERQALAMMDHPNIAKVLDAGTTPFLPSPLAGEGPGVRGGLPYFVMELVQGVPITDYCDQCNLSTRERLELFVSVCQAVQHAHQKGVIHRDIKPTNVLVAIQDGRAAPKIIDFGVAKAINQRLTEHTLATGYAQIIGTPLYMSPEQAELSPLGADTRSDIYSLGVLLYELLTGSTPFDKDRLHSVPYDELRRIIREEEPPRPSARLNSLSLRERAGVRVNSSLPLAARDQTRTGDPKSPERSAVVSREASREGETAKENALDLATIAERRHTDARRLQQTVRGELDWIVMKCLEKDRNRRYDSAGGLSRDIERYLHDEPVQACPPSAGYRFRKFARRNKSLLAAGGAIAAALAVGLGLFTWQYFRATTESARAKAVSDLLQQMLASADAANAKGADYRVRELLNDFSAGLGGQLAGQPEVEADIRATIGRAYRSLKLPEKAQPHFEKVIELRRRNDGPASEKLAAVLVDGGWNLLDQQRRDEAESQLNEALAIYRGRGVSGAPLFHALEILQHVLIGSSDRDADAERITQEALDVAHNADQEFSEQANLLHRYADLKIRQEKFAEAEQVARQAVDMHRRLHGDRHPETAFGLKTLARALEPQQKLTEAEKVLRESLTIFRRLFPEDHPNVRDTIDQLSIVLQAHGDRPAVEALEKEGNEIAMPYDSPDYHVRLAGLLLANHPPNDDQKVEAHRLVRLAIEEYGQVAVDSPRDLDRRANALKGYVQAIKHCIAVPDFAGEVDELNRRLAAELPQLLAAFPDSSDCQFQTAWLYKHWAFWLGAYTAYLPLAERGFRESIELFEKVSHSDPKRHRIWFYLANSTGYLGDVLWEAGQQNEAGEAYRRSMQIYDEHAAVISTDPIWPITDDYARFAYELMKVGQKDKAAEFIRKAALNTERMTYPRHPCLSNLAIARLYVGDEAGYRETCRTFVKDFGTSIDDNARLNMAIACVLGAHAVDDLNVPLQQFEETVSERPDVPYLNHWLLGALVYRAGDYERAEQHLALSIATYPADPRYGVATVHFPKLFLAMAKWQQGERDEARRMLADLPARIDAERRSAANYWQFRAMFDVLRREAETLIEPKEADEAVENKTRTSDEPKQ